MQDRSKADTSHSQRPMEWLSEHRYGVVLLYIPVYLLIFLLLELFPHSEFHLIYSPIDSLIPTVPAFIIAYALWWLLFPASLIWFYLMEGREAFLKLCFILFSGYTVCLICYFVYPNGLELREPLTGNDIFSRAVELLRSIDTPQHVCPSMHVSSTVAISLSLKDAKRIPAALKGAIHLSGLLIIISTMLIKQHSVIDVFYGILLSLILCILWKPALSCRALRVFVKAKA